MFREPETICAAAAAFVLFCLINNNQKKKNEKRWKGRDPTRKGGER